MQENKIGGSAPLKNEIRRLSSGISFAASQVEMMAVNPKVYKKEEMELVFRGIVQDLTAFVRSYSAILKKNREKAQK
jgi:hypothetical protein